MNRSLFKTSFRGRQSAGFFYAFEHLSDMDENFSARVREPYAVAALADDQLDAEL